MPSRKDVPQIGADYLRWKLSQPPTVPETKGVPLDDPEVQKRIGTLSPAVQKLVLSCAQVPIAFTHAEFREKFLEEAHALGVTMEFGTDKYGSLYHKLGPYISLVREYTVNLNSVPSIRGSVNGYLRRSGKRSGRSRQ